MLRHRQSHLSSRCPAALLLAALVCAALGLGCERAARADMPRASESVAMVEAPPSTSASRWLAVRQWLLQLQNLDVDRAADAPFDLIVTDYSRDGSAARRLTPAELERLKARPGSARLVLSYLSIGEAEDYRYYWQRGWRPGNPDWLMPVNPQWRGNYPVQYWRPEWHKILYGSPDAYLDRIIDAGFDGVYLDIVDGYEHFESTRPTARAEMVQLLRSLARHARVTRNRPDFGIFPQNGQALIDVPGYLDVIDGVGREDMYYGNPRDNTRSPAPFTEELERELDRHVAAGKLVLTVDYTQQPRQIADAYQRAREHGYVPYATVRSLDRMVINHGTSPN